eukprot:CAMPEP_0181337720 /NCGR_PEP_ID=MMETSP1101-20121128/28187_1 /TAXON_ID=46948 /ORGANISM="Rhodomonas abbreviata, Strain Caron Lab Isolate" /LENGTH=77 /DNA_ID=CAMNT_0023448269 /DNA_START=200 /DNA_END=433 /DNA_ORIENTATION=-
MFDILSIQSLMLNKKEVGNLPAFSTEREIPHTAWKMAFAAGRVANHGNVAKQEQISFGARNTVEDADRLNTQGNFSS